MPTPTVNRPTVNRPTVNRPDEEESPTRGPFDLVNEFLERRRQMGRPDQGGFGAFQPQQPRTTRDDYVNQLKFIGAARGGQQQPPAPARGGAPQKRRSGLINWQGKRIDASVLPYAQQIQQRFPGLRFSSGYRDPVHNARVGGVPNSWHLKGRALDFSGSAKDMRNAAAWARQNGAREVLVHNAGSGTHLHVAW